VGTEEAEAAAGVEEEEALVTGEAALVTGEAEEDSEEEVEDSGLPRVEDFGGEVAAAEVPQEEEEAEEEGAAAEGDLEEERGSWLSHTDTKECSSAEARRMPW